MAATTALREALNLGISSGHFIDTKIILYSRRDSSGRVCRPRALYANSHVLKKVPYFQGLLFGDFTESQSKVFTSPIDEEESAEHYGYFSDSDLEDDEDEKATPLTNTSESNGNQPSPPTIPGSGNSCEDQDEHTERGKVVKIPDMAFLTFQAFLMYLYTDVIEFAPFGSKENRRSRSTEIVDPSDDKIPRPSPKSIYRLADKYDVPALKDLAFNHIRGQLANCDIVEEAFSRFAFQYDEIRNKYVEQLAFTWVEDSTENTRTSVEKKVCSFVEGDIDHAVETLAALWEIASNDEDITGPANTPLVATQVTSPVHWVPVKRALIKSIRRGVFFDKKYWARQSKAVDALKPVYFSSTIMNDKAQQLGKLVKYFNGRERLISSIEGDSCAESDCEGESPGTNDEPPKTTEESEDLTHAVLVTGSFSAWKCLFFYRCTDLILFAPLMSHGAESRSNYVRENTVVAAPPPCSPKSVYLLANLLGIQPLCDKALADIKSKVNSDNIVAEVFSQVTAGQKEVMEMQCELLISNFKKLETIALVKENIRHVPDGAFPHCAGALNLVLKKAFELKKQKKTEAPGAMLQCITLGCPQSCEFMSYSCAGSSAYCPDCRNFMYCTCCGFQRTSVDPSCRYCRGRFI